MFTTHNPDSILAPLGPYSHGLEIPAGSRLLLVSGQTPGLPDGRIAQGIEAQSEVVWTRIEAILRSAGMGTNHIVKVNTYLRHRSDAPAYARVRARFLGEHRPAMLGLVIADLFNIEYLLEVEVLAAQPT